VRVDDGKVEVALANAVHQKKCEGYRDALEAALGARVGGPVGVVLVVDGSPAPRTGGGAAAATPAATHDETEEEIDLDALVDAPSTAERRGADKLVDAFPGAELFEDDP
jgi:hypothetical protein